MRKQFPETEVSANADASSRGQAQMNSICPLWPAVRTNRFHSVDSFRAAWSSAFAA